MPSHSRVTLVGTGVLAASVEELHGRGLASAVQTLPFCSPRVRRIIMPSEEAEGDWSFFSVSSVKSCPEKFCLRCDGRGLLDDIVRVSGSL